MTADRSITAGALRVLLVEDNHDIATSICDSLEHAGLLTDYAASAEQAIELLPANRYDVLVIDIMLPGDDGISLCQRIRRVHLSEAPVLMLTARDDMENKLQAFGSGADDYLTKPFAMPELLARIMALSRRSVHHEDSILQVGDLQIDLACHQVSREGRELHVTRTGFKMLVELVRASPAVVLRDDLENAVWGDDRPATDALRTHMSVLRSTVDKPFPLTLIETVHGIGWRLRSGKQ